MNTVQLAYKVDAVSFTKDNTDYYELTINTWLLLIQDVTGREPIEIKGFIARKGLMHAIATASKLADAIIHEEDELPHSPFIWLVDLNLDIKDLLFLLRYPKRFSPSGTDSLSAKCRSDFLSINNRAKMINRSHRYSIIDSWLKDILLQLLPPVSVDYTDWKLPEGAVYYPDTDINVKCQAGKLLAAERQIPNLLPNLPTWPGNCRPRMLYDYITIPSESYPHYKEVAIGNRTSLFTDVPKSYKARRGIAEEEVFTQLEHGCLADALLRSANSSKVFPFRSCVDLTNQGINRRRAQLGSLDGSDCTVDLSTASDCIPLWVIYECFPSWFVQEYDKIRTNRVNVNGKVYPLHISTTMGSRLTFPVETVLFYSIALLACQLYDPYDSALIRRISCYGDDTIVPSEVLPTYLELLEHFGGIVNYDKTHINSYSLGWYGVYRESCGAEYIGGYDISQHYLPRREFPAGHNQRLEFILGLQHKLVGYPRTNEYLLGLIGSRTTFSHINSDCEDAWSRWPDIQYKAICNEPLVQREVHTCFKEVKTCLNDPKYVDASQRYLYYQSLRFGTPSSEDPVLNLLGISDVIRDNGLSIGSRLKISKVLR